MSESKVKVAAVQAAPVFLDLEASLQKALALIEKAAAEGARLAVFPEAFLPAWPVWVDEALPGEDAAWHLRLLEQSVVVPGPVTARLGAAARAAGLHLVMGVDEREEHGGTIYNTLLYFDPDGRLLGKHRKLMPTHAERLVWGMGDGSDLIVHQTAVGRVGGLICWENYMPLARFAVYAQGIDIWVAPTLATHEPWVATMRHIAREGVCHVIGVAPGGPVLRGARQRARPRAPLARGRAARRLDAGRLLGDRRPGRDGPGRPAGPRGGHPVRHPRPGRRPGPPPPVRPGRPLQPTRRVPPGRRRPPQATPGLRDTVTRQWLD
jgi:predicted amidohydrolase